MIFDRFFWVAYHIFIIMQIHLIYLYRLFFFLSVKGSLWKKLPALVSNANFGRRYICCDFCAFCFYILLMCASCLVSAPFKSNARLFVQLYVDIIYHCFVFSLHDHFPRRESYLLITKSYAHLHFDAWRFAWLPNLFSQEAAHTI